MLVTAVSERNDVNRDDIDDTEMLYQPHSQLRWLCLSRNLIIKPRCSEASKLDARLSLLFISKMLHHRHLRDSCTDFLSMLIYRVLLLAFSIQSSLLLMAHNLLFEKVFFIYFLHLVNFATFVWLHLIYFSLGGGLCCWDSLDFVRNVCIIHTST